jgi:hypothetical protein
MTGGAAAWPRRVADDRRARRREDSRRRLSRPRQGGKMPFAERAAKAATLAMSLSKSATDFLAKSWLIELD